MGVLFSDHKSSCQGDLESEDSKYLVGGGVVGHSEVGVVWWGIVRW